MADIGSVLYVKNGEPCESLSILDRGLQYGDGVFETMLVEGGRIAYWQRHLSRLLLGADRLGIERPAEDELLSQAKSLCRYAKSGVLKIVLTRGAGGRGYRVPADAEPSCLLGLYPAPDYTPECRTAGVGVTVCNMRLGQNPELAGIKHLNRLEQVMARREWDDSDTQEGLMLDSHDHVISGTMSNVFLVRNGYLSTPDLTLSGINGIMRDVILEYAHLNEIPATISAHTMSDIREADELFLSNSLIGIWPVKRVDGHAKNVGPVTEKISAGVVTFGEPSGT